MVRWTLLLLTLTLHGARASEPAAAKLQHDLNDAIREKKAQFTIPSAEYVFGNSSLIIHSAKDVAITAEPGCQRPSARGALNTGEKRDFFRVFGHGP